MKAMTTASSSATMRRSRRGESRTPLRAASVLTTASRQADRVRGDAAPHDDIRGDDEAEILYVQFVRLFSGGRAAVASARAPLPVVSLLAAQPLVARPVIAPSPRACAPGAGARWPCARPGARYRRR